MMPALELMKHLAGQPKFGNQLNPTTLYWMTGFLSTILDNAPTYINMLTASMAKYGLDINIPSHVNNFISHSPIYQHFQGNINLMSISLASVIFGAFTYIGNGPNFIIKSIAEQQKIPMPSFIHYIIQYSIPFLIPVMFIIWLLFIR